MIRTTALVIAALAACIVPATAQTPTTAGDNRPILKAAATVSGDVVRIGDLVDNAGIVAKIPIFRAPDLGTTGVVSAAQVIEAVRAHALVGLDAGGVDEIHVTRASRAISIQAVETQIIASLASQYGIADGKNIALRFDRPPHVVQVDANATGDLRTSQLGYDARTGRFDVVIDIGYSPSSRIRLSGVAIPMTDVVLLTRGIARGGVIKQSDISVERRAKAEAGADVITSAELAVGRALRTPVNAGRPLRAADLGKAELVQRNEIVTVIYEVPGITLTVRGKANEGGAEGDVIEVLNVQSKRNVHGVVTGPGRVLVSALTANAIATSKLDKSASSAVVR